LVRPRADGECLDLREDDHQRIVDLVRGCIGQPGYAVAELAVPEVGALDGDAERARDRRAFPARVDVRVKEASTPLEFPRARGAGERGAMRSHAAGADEVVA